MTSLTVSTSTITAGLRNGPQPRGWRSRAILPALTAVVDGRQAVRVADVRAAAPFELTAAAQPVAAGE